MEWTIAMKAAVFAFNSLGYCCEICVPIQSTNPGCLIKQQMVKYCTPAILSQNSLLSDAALIITNLVETAIPRSHYLNMWCNNCSLIGCRMESHPSHIHFAFLSSFSWILTVSLFQMMNCLWWGWWLNRWPGHSDYLLQSAAEFVVLLPIFIQGKPTSLLFLSVKLHPWNLCFFIFFRLIFLIFLIFLHWSQTTTYNTHRFYIT